MWKWTVSLVLAALLPASVAFADMQAQQGTPQAGDWVKRIPVVPNPDKIVVPPGYKVGVFKAGLDTPSSAAVDKDGNLWVAISGQLFNTIDEIEPAHVKIFDKSGNVIKEIGRGVFKTVMNEIGYCAENDTMYIPEYGEKIWEMKGVNGELKLIIKDLSSAITATAASRARAATSILRSGSQAIPALPIPTTTAGPTSRMTPSGSSIKTVSAPRRTMHPVGTSSTRG